MQADFDSRGRGWCRQSFSKLESVVSNTIETECRRVLSRGVVVGAVSLSQELHQPMS